MPYYVYKGDRIFVKCNYVPSKQDLDSRGESCVQIDENVDILDYTIVDNKLVAKPKEPVAPRRPHDNTTHTHEDPNA